MYVADARKQSSLGEFYRQFERDALASVQTISMDMWQPYIASTLEHVPEASKKIAFDKFHVTETPRRRSSLLRPTHTIPGRAPSGCHDLPRCRRARGSGARLTVIALVSR